MAERRKFARFGAFLDAFQLHDVVFAQPEKIKSRVEDVSREGLRLFAKNLLPKGSSVKLEMSIPGDNFPIYAYNEIMWSRKASESVYEMGTRFKDIKNEDKSRLLDYAYEEWRKLTKQNPVNRV